MKDPVRVEIEVVEEFSKKGNEIGMAALVRVNYPVLEQDEQLPFRLEMISQEAGLQFMRKFFGLGIEKADLELVLSLRAGKDGKGIVRIGKRPYTFKTIFGTVSVPRIRIKYKGSGKSETPSARIWKTKRQVLLSKGLKNAVCNTVIKESYASTVSQIERQTGERAIVSKSTVGNILRQEGERLAIAQAERADKVFEDDERAKVLLGRAAVHLGQDYFERVWLKGVDLERMSKEEVEQLFYQVEWDPYEELVKTSGREHQEKALAQSKELPEIVRPEAAEQALIAIALGCEQETVLESDNILVEQTHTISAMATGIMSQPSEIAEQVIAQVDEVVVRKQPGSKRERVVHYNGVIKTSQRSYYCSSTTSAELIYQMGSILAQLGVHKSDKRLLVLSDCAGWINNWVRGIGIREKEAVMCWYHLRERCRELVGEAFTNKTDRDEVRKKLLKYLWRGQSAKAIYYVKKLIEDVEEGCSQLAVKSIKALEAIRNYLITRQSYIPDYMARYRNREWIASTQIEKFNDFSVSVRCKKENGMRWTSKGVRAIAALETARRNGELEEWQAQNRLPSWSSLIAA